MAVRTPRPRCCGALRGVPKNRIAAQGKRIYLPLDKSYPVAVSCRRGAFLDPLHASRQGHGAPLHFETGGDLLSVRERPGEVCAETPGTEVMEAAGRITRMACVDQNRHSKGHAGILAYAVPLSFDGGAKVRGDVGFPQEFAHRTDELLTPDRLAQYLVRSEPAERGAQLDILQLAADHQDREVHLLGVELTTKDLKLSPKATFVARIRELAEEIDSASEE